MFHSIDLQSLPEFLGLLNWEKLHALVGTVAAAISIFLAGREFYRRRRVEKKLVKAQQTLSKIEKAADADENNIWSIWPKAVPEWFHVEWPKSKLRVIVLANFKGGVGKTTIAANLAMAFANANYRVLVIDFDYQGSQDSRFNINATQKANRKGSSALLEKNGDLFDTSTRLDLTGQFEKISLVPSFFRLARTENKLMLHWLVKGEDEKDDDARFRLAKKLMEQRVSDEFDLIIIDTPPRLTAGTVNALCVCTDLLVPTMVDPTSIEAVKNFVLVARTFQQKYNSKLQIRGVIPSLTPESGLKRSEKPLLENLDKELKELGFPSLILPLNVPRKTTEAVITGITPLYFADDNCTDVFDRLVKSLNIPQRSGQQQEANYAHEGFGIGVSA